VATGHVGWLAGCWTSEQRRDSATTRDSLTVCSTTDSAQLSSAHSCQRRRRSADTAAAAAATAIGRRPDN